LHENENYDGSSKFMHNDDSIPHVEAHPKFPQQWKHSPLSPLSQKIPSFNLHLLSTPQTNEKVALADRISAHYKSQCMSTLVRRFCLNHSQCY